jgi:hypothetical protein
LYQGAFSLPTLVVDALGIYVGGLLFAARRLIRFSGFTLRRRFHAPPITEEPNLDYEFFEKTCA